MRRLGNKEIGHEEVRKWGYKEMGKWGNREKDNDIWSRRKITIFWWIKMRLRNEWGGGIKEIRRQVEETQQKKIDRPDENKNIGRKK